MALDRSCGTTDTPVFSAPSSGPAGNAPSAPLSVAGRNGKPLSTTTRVNLAFVGIGLLVVWAIARGLEPSPSGLGTHQQMGLPPCTFRLVFNMRCPSCGMTTSWAHLARGNLWAALRANSGGAVLGLLSMVVAPWSCWTAWRGHAGRTWPSDWFLLIVALAVGGVTVADWLSKI